MEIDISVEARGWESMDIAGCADCATAAVARRLSLPADCEVTLLACDDTRIAALNADFRGKPRPTNVLSWPAQELSPPELPMPDPDGSIHLGDIALAYETCAREAEGQGKSLADHTTHLILHGLLHLLGYDHETDADAARMEALEVEILGKLGISDPYS